MKKSQIKDRLASLMKTQDKARQLAPLAENEVVQEFFSALEERLIGEMGKCTLEDDAGRRHRAYLLHTMRNLRHFINETPRAGARAEERYAQLIELDSGEAK